MIQENTLAFTKELNIEYFQALDDWLQRWKERNNITFKIVSGKSKSVTPEMVFNPANLDYFMNAF